MGIEPTSEAWEASILPLNYTRGGRRPTLQFRISNFGLQIPPILGNSGTVCLRVLRYEAGNPANILKARGGDGDGVEDFVNKNEGDLV